MTQPSSSDRTLTRRSLLDWLVVAGSGVVTAVLAIPALAYLWPAAKGGAAEAAEVEGAKSMTPGQSKTLQVGGKAVIVVRDRSGFRAFSAVCTHLGCLVKWDAASKHFLCPCHAAIFAEDGSVVSGPPPAPLPGYKVKEVGDKVFVSAA
jgi:cytochrome b6-f complex iron-sulfur subunit